MRLKNIDAHFKGPFPFQDFHVIKTEKPTLPPCGKGTDKHLFTPASDTTIQLHIDYWLIRTDMNVTISLYPTLLICLYIPAWK